MKIAHANKTANVLFVLGCRNVFDGLCLLWKRLDTILGDPKAETLEFGASEEQFLGIHFESGITKMLENFIESCKVSVPVTFGDDEKVINAGSNKFKICKDVAHFFLKHVGTVAQAHRESLTFAFAPRQC